MDEVLPNRENLVWGFPSTSRSWTSRYRGLFKGLGAYLSTYLMTDVGQRVVRDLRNRLFRHILDQSAGSSRGTSGR